jgi:CDP-4-dehydro-6-deoxyglucose reductase, E1
MIDYPLASSTWDHKELEAIQSVIDSGIYTMGESVVKFEESFANFFNTRFSVMVSSGSTANLLIAAALFYTKKPRLKRGDEVIVPAVSWSTTYFPLQQYGLKLKFVDIDLETLNYDLNALESAITKETRMIMTVNLLGNSNNFNIINELINGKDIILIEDNCESMGALFEGKYAGTFGLMGSFSTFFSHHMCTMEGGMITTDDEELYHILLSLRAHGWTRNLPKINHISSKSDDWFEESFRFVLPGYNVRPLEMSGAIGLQQLKKLPDFLQNRRKNAKLFLELFKDNADFFIQKSIGDSSWFGFSLIIKPSSNYNRRTIVDLLTKNNIDCRPIVTGNFTRNEVMQYIDYEIHKELVNANYLHDNGFFVGNHHVPIEDEIIKLYEILQPN